MALGHTGNLDMAHTPRRQVLAQLHGHITFHNLAVVQVHLHLEIGRCHQLHQVVRLGLRLQEVARHVPAVDGLDQHLHPGIGRSLCRPAQIAQRRIFQQLARRALGHPAAHQMNARAAQRLCIAQGLEHTGLEHLLLPRQTQRATHALLPGSHHGLGRITARWRIEQHLLQASLRQRIGQHFRRIGIGKQIFHRGKTIGCSGSKALQKWQLGVHQ